MDRGNRVEWVKKYRAKYKTTLREGVLAERLNWSFDCVDEIYLDQCTKSEIINAFLNVKKMRSTWRELI